MWFTVVLLLLAVASTSAFRPMPMPRTTATASRSLHMSLGPHLDNLLQYTMQLADTSISEEEVLGTVGQANNLPDPIYAVIFGGVIVLGVGILQFSLGDLTKEEGQARVRDFLQTKRDTERKRGYFD
mmetsp:Transcript_30277/g.67010  ORF Transcript_30277/g.67010 Transcript_30277/m.67010 type:complete len:127 (-) Transcript_30277:64-444(-)